MRSPILLALCAVLVITCWTLPAACLDAATQDLHAAVVKDDVAAIAAALSRGADIDGRERGFQTPLHRSALMGRAVAAKALLEAGADALAKDDSGFNCLHMAGLRGRDAVTRVLLDHGGQDVNEMLEDG
jgi:ankyrin repeat protein